MHYKTITTTIIDFIIDEVKKRKSKGLVIGLSGGLDSSVAATLAVKALGSGKVFGLILPEFNITPKSDVDDAQELAKDLKIKHKVIEITMGKRVFLKQLPKNKLAQGNFTARLRMCLIYYYATLLNRLVLGASDKSEIKLGYYTKHGDGAADILPIADLYKTEVREMAKFLQITPVISNKISSPRLWKDQTAETEIGMPYEEIDEILRQLDNNSIINNRWKPYSKGKINRILHLTEKNKHKQEMPAICSLDKYRS
jgi:NAD+ synthase